MPNLARRTTARGDGQVAVMCGSPHMEHCTADTARRSPWHPKGVSPSGSASSISWRHCARSASSASSRSHAGAGLTALPAEGDGAVAPWEAGLTALTRSRDTGDRSTERQLRSRWSTPAGGSPTEAIGWGKKHISHSNLEHDMLHNCPLPAIFDVITKSVQSTSMTKTWAALGE